MKQKITPLMIFGILLLIVVIITWNTIPEWKSMKGGLWILISVAAVGVIAFLKDGISFIKTWMETQAIQDSQTNMSKSMEEGMDSQATNIKWESRDPKLVNKYFELCAKYDEKFKQYNKEDKQIEHFISFGLAKRDGNQLFLTQAGVLMVCKQDIFPHAILHADIIFRNEEQGHDIEQKRDFSGAILETYFQVYELLIPLTKPWKASNIRNQSGQEEVFFYYPEAAITELLINFFIHRDYLQDDIGYITVYKDRIEFVNPGISPITAEELLTSEKPLRPLYQRNPRLLQALRKTGLNQSEGRGILRTRNSLIRNKTIDPAGNLGLHIENDEKVKRFRLVLYKKIPTTITTQVEKKYRLLIIEDDLDIAEMLNAYFLVQGYEVTTANWGKKGVQISQQLHPDLIILDIRLPDIDGYEVARQLRQNRYTSDIPIIFLTEKKERTDRLKGFEVGGDDYITKPFDVQELRLRVRNVLVRTTQTPLNNPVTGLPENIVVAAMLSEALEVDNISLLHVSIKNMASFRENYGFVASDDVLRAICLMITHIMKEFSEADNFLGHITTTDLLLMVSPTSIEPLRDKLNAQLSQATEYFYPVKVRNQLSSQKNKLAFKISAVTELLKNSTTGNEVIEKILRF